MANAKYPQFVANLFDDYSIVRSTTAQLSVAGIPNTISAVTEAMSGFSVLGKRPGLLKRVLRSLPV